MQSSWIARWAGLLLIVHEPLLHAFVQAREFRFNLLSEYGVRCLQNRRCLEQLMSFRNHFLDPAKQVELLPLHMTTQCAYDANNWYPVNSALIFGE